MSKQTISLYGVRSRGRHSWFETGFADVVLERSTKRTMLEENYRRMVQVRMTLSFS